MGIFDKKKPEPKEKAKPKAKAKPKPSPEPMTEVLAKPEPKKAKPAPKPAPKPEPAPMKLTDIGRQFSKRLHEEFAALGVVVRRSCADHDRASECCAALAKAEGLAQAAVLARFCEKE